MHMITVLARITSISPERELTQIAPATRASLPPSLLMSRRVAMNRLEIRTRSRFNCRYSAFLTVLPFGIGST